MSASPSLSRAIGLIVATSRLFSVLPFSILRKNRNPNTYVFKATIAGFIISIGKATLQLFITYVMFATLFNVYQHHKSVTNLFLVLTYSTANMLAVVHEICGALNQRQVVEILNDLQFLDDELLALNIFPNNKNVLRIAAGLGLVIAFLWGTLASMHELIFMDSVVLWVGFILPYLLICISTFHFLGLVILIGQRFQLLNDNLRELVNYMNGLNKLRILPFDSDVILGIQYRLHILQRLRGTLVTICEKVNSAYSVQLLIMFTTYFTIFVQKFHRVTMVTNDTPLSLANGTYVALWLLTTALILTAVCWACTTCISHSKNTAKIMFHLDPAVQDSHMRVFYEQFMMQLLHSNVNFTVCGLFSIELPLLFGMTSTIAGYIVICIQFSWNP